MIICIFSQELNCGNPTIQNLVLEKFPKFYPVAFGKTTPFAFLK